jgi:Kef-type K+ transport system membrane component KefB
MFVAGLEIDLVEFKRTRNRSLSLGLSTFLVPMMVGTGVGRLFNFGWNPSILIGSLMASHTLLAYPIVQRLGVVKREAVMITVGATIFTDIAALLVLAVCLAIHAGNFSAGTLILQLTALAVYSFVVLVGFDWAGKALRE